MMRWQSLALVETNRSQQVKLVIHGGASVLSCARGPVCMKVLKRAFSSLALALEDLAFFADMPAWFF